MVVTRGCCEVGVDVVEVGGARAGFNSNDKRQVRLCAPEQGTLPAHASVTQGEVGEGLDHWSGARATNGATWLLSK